MESPPFIPHSPSTMSSNESYFTPQICANTEPSSLEVDLCTIYQSQRSRPYPQPDQMSSNASINLSNVLPAESLAPLPIPQPLMLAPLAMLPCTVHITLQNNPNINTVLLQMIANGLLSMIAKQETKATMNHHHFMEQVKGLQEWVLHYEETFECTPEGYILNDSHVPHFHIPVGNGLHHLAKWIKLNEDGTVLGYADIDSTSSQPHTSSTYTLKPTMTMTVTGKQSQLCQSWHGSDSSWWALPPTSTSYIVHSLNMMIGGSPTRSTAIATLTMNMPTLPSSSSTFKSNSMPFKMPMLLVSLASCLHMLLSRLRHSRTYHVSLRPPAWKHKSTGHGLP